MNKQEIDTFSYLYDNIIKKYLDLVCTKIPEYGLRASVNGRTVFLELKEKFSEYRDQSKKRVTSSRLDRHKLASCICGAIIAVQPLVPKNRLASTKALNEYVAVQSGLSVIKSFMIEEFLLSQGSLSENQRNIMYKHLSLNYPMSFPKASEEICDSQNYGQNLYNALFWSHSICTKINNICPRYDIWAYSTIFYHLEVYNQKPFKEFCDEAIKKLPKC